MTYPFIQRATRLWQDVLDIHRDLFPLMGEHYALVSNALLSPRPKDTGDAFARQRCVQTHGQKAQDLFDVLDAKVTELQSHFLATPILGAEDICVEFFYNTPELKIGPWAHYGISAKSYAQSLDFVTDLARIAHQDGSQKGKPYALDVASRAKEVYANDFENARALFDLCQEDAHIYLKTNTTQTPAPFDLPLYESQNVPRDLYLSLWDALKQVRAQGFLDALVFLSPNGATLNDIALVKITPRLSKEISLDTSCADLDPKYKATLEKVVQAVNDLYLYARQKAPILKSLDPFKSSGSAHFEDSTDTFIWGAKTQSLTLLNGGGFWGDRFPICRMREPQFQYAFNKVLGALTHVPDSPTQGWVSSINGVMVPGNTVQDAALLSAALAVGQKAKFVPGARVTSKDMSPNWTRVTLPPNQGKNI